MRRHEPPDLTLFAVFAIALFVALSFLDLVGGGETLAHDTRHAISGGPGSAAAAGRAVVLALCTAVPAAGLGYGAQALAVRWGFRLTGRPAKGDAADYDDKPPPPPPPAG
jgi:hypothetical protein